MLKIGLPSLEMSKNSIIQEKLLRYDLENIFKVVEKYNLQPVLLNYPPPTNDKYNIRADAASCHNAAFVDIYSAFKKLEEMPGYDVRNFLVRMNIVMPMAIKLWPKRYIRFCAILNNTSTLLVFLAFL